MREKAIPITSKYSKITPHFFFFSSQPTHNTELGLANSVDLWVNSKSIFFSRKMVIYKKMKPSGLSK